MVQCVTYLSISETYLVKKFPLLKSRSEPCPPNKRPRFVNLTMTSLASSPMYIPEIIFSNLEQDYVVVNALCDSK